MRKHHMLQQGCWRSKTVSKLVCLLVNMVHDGYRHGISRDPDAVREGWHHACLTGYMHAVNKHVDDSVMARPRQDCSLLAGAVPGAMAVPAPCLLPGSVHCNGLQAGGALTGRLADALGRHHDDLPACCALHPTQLCRSAGDLQAT
jgi:hypothetical protein